MARAFLLLFVVALGACTTIKIDQRPSRDVMGPRAAASGAPVASSTIALNRAETVPAGSVETVPVMPRQR